MKTSVILLAGGSGSRIKSDIPKQYLLIKNKPIAVYSFDLFCTISEVEEIIVVCRKAFQDLFEQAFELHEHRPSRLIFAEPGDRRQDSVYQGFKKISLNSSLVCIHDAARPLVQKEAVLSVLQAGHRYGAATLGMPLKFTIKECNDERLVTQTPDRSKMWEIQTPQVIRPELLREGFKKVILSNLTVTDDTSLVELLEHPVKLVEGSYSNIKITTKEDLVLAEYLLEGVKNLNKEKS